jgi:hypothetical protein
MIDVEKEPMKFGAERMNRYYADGKISKLGEHVANLLNDVWCGIYHIEDSALRKIDWTNEDFIRLSIYGGLNSYDDDKLTQLVILAHDYCLRLEINPCNFNHLELLFHQRDRVADFYHRMPTMEDHLEQIRKYHPRVY